MACRLHLFQFRDLRPGRSSAFGGWLLLAILLAAAAKPATANPRRSTWTLVPASDSSNRFEIGVAAGFFTGSDVADVSGTLEASLFWAIDPGEPSPDANVEQLAITSGDLDFSPVSFVLTSEFLPDFEIFIDGTNIGGTIATINPPTTVVAETFDATDQRLTVDRGVFDVTGLGEDGQYDISEMAFGGPGAGSGQLTLSEVDRQGTVVSYDARLLLPYDYVDQGVPITGSPLTLDLSVQGTIEAVSLLRIDLAGPGPDADLDGDVDGRDFLDLQSCAPEHLAAWQSLFGTNSSPAVVVPEPAALLLATLLAGCFFLRGVKPGSLHKA